MRPLCHHATREPSIRDVGIRIAQGRKMDDPALLLRIRAVVVSTRAAVRSLGPGSDQVSDVIQRGLRLLDELEPQVMRYGGEEPRARLDRARDELASQLRDTGA